VRDGLFISDLRVPQNRESLRADNITRVVSICPISQKFEDISYFDLSHLDDSHEENILIHFPKCVEFINQEINQGNSVLVHCAAGISRSSSFVCAYLMWSERITFNKALEEVRKARPWVSPNYGFVKQLNLWYNLGYQLEGTTKAHAIYKMQHSAKIVREGTDLSDISLIYSPDPQKPYYMCSNCKLGLFTKENIMEHDKSVDSWGWKDTKKDLECTGYYLQPMEWMKEQIQKKKDGEFLCPTKECGVNLGSWNWDQVECSCETEVVPSFVIFTKSVSFSEI